MIKFITASVVLLGLPIGAIAAPFCLVLSNGSSQCIYVDGAECASEARRANHSRRGAG